MGKKKRLVPKTLRFVEQYLDEEPPTGPNEPRYWRGITAYLENVVTKDDWVFQIRYNPKVNRFDEEDHFTFETCLGTSGDDFRENLRGVTKTTKEGAKAFAQEMFNEYVLSLCNTK